MLDEAETLPQLLITEYLPGPEYSVDAFRHDDVEVALPRLRTKIRSGISFSNVFENDQDMISHTLSFAAGANLAGVFGVQFKRDSEGRPIVLECNPRVQGTMVASQADVDWDARFVRYWGGVGVAGDVGYEI